MNKLKKLFGALLTGIFFAGAFIFVLLFVVNAFMWAHDILLEIEPTTLEWVGVACISVIIAALGIFGFMIDDSDDKN